MTKRCSKAHERLDCRDRRGVAKLPVAFAVIAVFARVETGPAGMGMSRSSPSAPAAKPTNKGTIDWENGTMTAPSPAPSSMAARAFTYQEATGSTGH